MKPYAPWFLFGICFGVAAMLAVCGIARADPGIDTDAEYNYVVAYGAGAVCPMIEANQNVRGVVNVLRGVMADGFDEQSAADIVNSSVWNYCRDLWPLLNEVNAKLHGNAIEKRIYA